LADTDAQGRRTDGERRRRLLAIAVGLALAIVGPAFGSPCSCCVKTERGVVVGERKRSGLLTPAEAAAQLGIAENVIREELRAGRLQGRVIGGRWFIDPQDLTAWHAARMAQEFWSGAEERIFGEGVNDDTESPQTADESSADVQLPTVADDSVHAETEASGTPADVMQDELMPRLGLDPDVLLTARQIEDEFGIAPHRLVRWKRLYGLRGYGNRVGRRYRRGDVYDLLERLGEES